MPSAYRDIPVEAAIPIYEKIPGNEKVFVYELPGVEDMACTVHHGSFNSLGQAYNTLLAWVENNGYRIIGSTASKNLLIVTHL